MAQHYTQPSSFGVAGHRDNQPQLLLYEEFTKAAAL
jgi:hypothetical protein